MQYEQSPAIVNTVSQNLELPGTLAIPKVTQPAFNLKNGIYHAESFKTFQSFFCEWLGFVNSTTFDKTVCVWDSVRSAYVTERST